MAIPVLTTINPILSEVGNRINLVGTGFTGATVVTFTTASGTLNATFSEDSDTQGTCFVQTGTISGPVFLDHGDGPSNSIEYQIGSAIPRQAWRFSRFAVSGGLLNDTDTTNSFVNYINTVRVADWVRWVSVNVSNAAAKVVAQKGALHWNKDLRWYLRGGPQEKDLVSDPHPSQPED